jgi:hypothetical protein
MKKQSSKLWTLAIWVTCRISAFRPLVYAAASERPRSRKIDCVAARIRIAATFIGVTSWTRFAWWICSRNTRIVANMPVPNAANNWRSTF